MTKEYPEETSILELTENWEKETRFRLSDCWQKCQASLEEVDDLDSSIANSYYEEQSKIESLQEAIKLIESEGIYREWMRMPVINIKDIKDAK
jgi:hypothetical protein